MKPPHKISRYVFATADDWLLLVLRLVLGLVFFAHGAQKMLGWFGGFGFHNTMSNFTGDLHIPVVFAFLAIAAEFFGGIALMIGVLTRLAALGIMCNMIMAIILVHHHYFFMNWFGNQASEGFEYHLIAATLGLVLLVRGGGCCSLDRAILLELRPARQPEASQLTCRAQLLGVEATGS